MLRLITFFGLLWMGASMLVNLVHDLAGSRSRLPNWILLGDLLGTIFAIVVALWLMVGGHHG